MLLVDQAYEDIKNMICNFELIPGQIVSDFTLSKKMGMSRTPIRQALQKLEGDDLIVDAGAGKSYQVSPITEDGIIDLFDAREGIEVAAVRIALEKGIDETRLIELERKYQDKAYRDHQMILEGLKSGDSRLAQQALAEHIETARLDYLRVMKEKNITEDFGMLRFFR